MPTKIDPEAVPYYRTSTAEDTPAKGRPAIVQVKVLKTRGEQPVVQIRTTDGTIKRSVPSVRRQQ